MNEPTTLEALMNQLDAARTSCRDSCRDIAARTASELRKAREELDRVKRQNASALETMRDVRRHLQLRGYEAADVILLDWIRRHDPREEDKQ